MPFKVPPHQVVGIKGLLELPSDKVTQLLSALEAAEPQFNTFDLSEKVAIASELPRPLVHQIIDTLASLYVTLDQTQAADDLSLFLDGEVYPSLLRAKAIVPEEREAQWKKLKAFFEPALAFEKSVGTTAKAGYVLTEHERILDGAKIMTDLRPIYHRHVSDRPDAGLIIHTMKLTQRNKYGERKDFYFALDSNDISLMRHIIERAVQKEATLREIVRDSGVKVLDPKATY